MKIWKAFLPFLLTMLFSLNAAGGFNTGNELKKDLDDPVYGAQYGFGYIVGVTDVLLNIGYICLPSGESGVRAGQIKDVVKKYLSENPEKLHMKAERLVYSALSVNWTCPKQAQPSASGSKPKSKPKDKDTSPF